MNGAASLAVALSLLSYALVLHVVVWRIRPPRRYLFWFLKYWLVAPLVAVLLWLVMKSVGRGAVSWTDVLTWAGGFVSYLALCASFILVYPAISMSSLSLEILRYLKRHGPQRLGALNLASGSGTAMLDARRDNLQASGMFRTDGDKLILTSRGKLVASTIDAVRWMLAIPRGSGG